MRALVALLVVAFGAIGARADDDAAAPKLVIDDGRTRVVRLAGDRARVELFYEDGARFVKATFDTRRPHSVFWRGVGRATMYYPDGRRLAEGPSAWSHRGTTTYWLTDGRWLATIRHTPDGDRVAGLGPLLRAHPAAVACRDRLEVLGPQWAAIASSKHLAAALRPFSLRCGEGPRYYWSFDGGSLGPPHPHPWTREPSPITVVNPRTDELHTRR